MSNGNRAAHPQPMIEDYNGKVITPDHNSTGLTKREHFAAMAMQGQLASLTPQMIDLYVSQAEDERLSGTRQLIAENSVRHADALLKALEK